MSVQVDIITQTIEVQIIEGEPVAVSILDGVSILTDGTLAGVARAIEFLSGSNVTITAEKVDNKIRVTINSTASSSGGGTWGSITGTLSNQTDLQTALNAKQALVNSATALVDASTMDLTAIKHTLTTSAATRTFTISYTGDDITLEVTLNAVTSTYTFPATSLCVYNGTASGDNTLILNGVSGDKYIIAIKKIGSAYYVVSKNFGQ